MKKISILAAIAFLAIFEACSSPAKEESNGSHEAPKSMVADPPSYDPDRGEGKWTEENINLKEELNPEWVASGESISNTKCTSCHKLTAEKLVGPGWEGVTKRRKPEWIMNFITNPDVMIDKDPEAQAMLELCLVRMPNQNLSDGEARNILEFMLKNDGAK
ncbi:c-type cytochrome [Aurantibacillus circumpalustris]|uniref:c-type cytochrome n=1 Tax=Aurantibacillus circumpalustris TaxID=3036359 RepID=UPI00295A6D58|nr:c-type cytochrome [Aurantibacillus circumpalustris]